MHKSEPQFKSLGDGFFGLSPSRGIGGSSEMNLLQQIQDRGMIKHKVIGVHTQMRNSTEDPSEMRFGGYNEGLFKEGHEQIWMNTTNPMSWEVKFDSVGFHSDIIW